MLKGNRSVCRIVLGALVAGFLLTACEEEMPTALPPETQEGKNTFGCYIDGKLFVAYKSGLYRPSKRAHISGNNRLLSISGENDGSDEPFIAINLFKSDSTLTQGTHRLVLIKKDSTLLPISDVIPVWMTKGRGCFLELDTLAGGGTVTITYLDTVRKIVSGRFEFRARGECNQTAHVTEGRFDLKYDNVYR